MTSRFVGTPPFEFGNELLEQMLDVLNEAALNLESELTQATPVGVGGLLRSSWSSSLANPATKRAVVSNSQRYLLPLELGRKPGSGISRKGQESVALWAKRVLGESDPKEAAGFAYLLSEQYKREGRPAQGFIGLARPGTTPTDESTGELTPVPNSLLDEAFKSLERELRSI